MAEINDADGGSQKGGKTPPGTPANSGPATGAGAVKVGVYEQPARPAQSPLMKWLPILIGIAALAFFAYRYFGAAPAPTVNDTTNSAPAAASRDSGEANRMSGSGAGGGSTTNNGGSGTPSSSRASGGSTTTNPPGPAGAATRP